MPSKTISLKSFYHNFDRFLILVRYLNETMNSFSNDIEEVTFLLESNKLTVKNYTETELNGNLEISYSR